MPRSEDIGLLTLAERRIMKFPNGDELRTPVLVPSFSSRVSQIDTILRASEQFIDGPLLVSAFDVGNNLISPPFDFAGPVFLDSGGYELTKESDLSDVGSEPPGDPGDWSLERHRNVLSSWKPATAGAVVSYDHPLLRVSIEEQIEQALGLFDSRPDLAAELLIKPETHDQRFLDVRSAISHVGKLAPFHAIGITEKEIGNSVLERMLNVARLRSALRNVGLNTPIHVFGSLDTITTLFYFIAGADIFDGLTWLRYAFKDGRTIYRQDYGITDLGISTKAPKVEARCWSNNYQYMKDMELEMQRFAASQDFNVFKYHGDLLRSAYKKVDAEVSTKWAAVVEDHIPTGARKV